MNPNHLPYWLATLYLPNIGPRKLKRWLTHFPSIHALFSASPAEQAAIGISSQDCAALANPDWPAVEKDLAWMQSSDDHHIMTIEDNDYPMLLKEIPDPPSLLFIRGNRATLTSKQLAIVGSRSPTPAGTQHAKQFAHHLAKTGFSITSGLALGIDAASHQGALQAKGITLAVAGTGLHHIYPPSHRQLVDEIVNHQGAILSEFPLDTQPFPAFFPKRNRIISGLSLGVLVVEAALKSGSLITARHALEQGREVFAIPSSIHHPLARGCHALIRQGAKLVEKAADIVEELGALTALFPTAGGEGKPTEKEALLPEFTQVLKQIHYEITPLDMILLRSGLTADKVYSILLTLELKGYIQAVAGGYVLST